MQRLHSPKQQSQFFDTPNFSSSPIEAPMRQSFQNFSRENNNKKPPHFPDSSRYSQIMASQSASQQLGNQNFNPPAPSHSRSLSQPPFFTLDNCLPPLSPLPHCPIAVDVSMEEKNANSHKSGNNTFGVTENTPPQKGHKRSNSDVPLGFSDMIQSSLQLIPIRSHMNSERLDKKPIQLVKQELNCNNNADGMESEGEVVDDLLTAYMNLDNMDTLNSSAAEDKDRDSRASGTKTNVGDSSDNEVESSINGITNGMLGTRLSFSTEKEGVKRSAGGEIAPTSRHCRSVSMDSFMGNLHFDGNSTKFSLEFGNGEFSGAELKKIMANEKLAEIASSDPKRVKRILANRQSAARSKERKLRYISELEHKVQTLQTEATTLSAQLTLLQRDTAGLTSQNNELKFRLQAMEQQAQLRDALHDALTMEVQRLKLTVAELSGETHPSNSMALQLSIDHQAFQLQHQQPTQLNIYQLQQQQQHWQRHQQQQHNQLQPLQQNGEAAKHESDKGIGILNLWGP